MTLTLILHLLSILICGRVSVPVFGELVVTYMYFSPSAATNPSLTDLWVCCRIMQPFRSCVGVIQHLFAEYPPCSVQCQYFLIKSSRCFDSLEGTMINVSQVMDKCAYLKLNIFSFQNEAKILLPCKNNSKTHKKISKNMIVVLIICQWEEDKMKNSIPGVNDIYSWF